MVAVTLLADRLELIGILRRHVGYLGEDATRGASIGAVEPRLVVMPDELFHTRVLTEMGHRGSDVGAGKKTAAGISSEVSGRWFEITLAQQQHRIVVCVMSEYFPGGSSTFIRQYTWKIESKNATMPGMMPGPPAPVQCARAAIMFISFVAIGKG
eukprot:SAG11_NODE_11265_length_772_cov_1.254086_1_plen_155_part_00